MVLPLLANPLLATGTFWALGCKAAFSLSSDLTIQGLGNASDTSLCTIPAGIWVGKAPGLPLFWLDAGASAIRPTRMDLPGLGSCPQLQTVSPGPGWGCQPLERLPRGTDPAVPALNPTSKPASRRPWGGHSEKTTQTQGRLHPVLTLCLPGMQQGGSMGWFHRLGANAGASPAPGTSHPVIWGTGRPHRKGVHGRQAPEGPGTPGQSLCCRLCSTGRGGGFCEHGGGRDGTLLP